jgi:WD40 repeat protein
MTGKIVWQIKAFWEPGFESVISSTVTFSPDGRMLAIGHWTVKLLDALTGKVVTEFEGHRGTVRSLAFSADGKRLASGSGDGSAIVWDLGAAR